MRFRRYYVKLQGGQRKRFWRAKNAEAFFQMFPDQECGYQHSRWR